MSLCYLSLEPKDCLFLQHVKEPVEATIHPPAAYSPHHKSRFILPVGFTEAAVSCSTSTTSYCFNLFFNWRKITLQFGCKIPFQCVLVSAVQHRESAIITHRNLSLEPPSSPPSHPLGHHRAPGWAPCVVQLLTSHLFYTW